MLHKSSTQLAFLSVLLLVLGFYVIFAEQEEVVGVEVFKGNQHHWWGCGHGSPWVRIESDNRFVHNHKVYSFEELIQHLTYEYYELPFDVVKIEAEENVRHDTLVRFSDGVLQRLPDMKFAWESYTETARTD